MNQDETILLFDGVCNLCSGSVQFVLKRNKQANIKFASLQSKFGQKLIEKSDLPKDYFGSLVLFKNGNTLVKSDAALELSKDLSGFWKLGAVFLIIPKFIRDAVYNWVARNRYSWFGKEETCWLPEPKWQHRFLD